MRALPFALSLFVASASWAMAATTGIERTAPHVDASRFYKGTWYEIGRRPMSLTDGCVAGGTTYTPQGGDQIQVLDFCHNGSPSGDLKTIGGPAQIMDPGTNAKLNVSYRVFGIFPLRRDYWVLEHASNYSWFISADPTFHDVWIYTRTPHPSKALVSSLVARVRALGYDTRLLEFPATGK